MASRPTQSNSSSNAKKSAQAPAPAVKPAAPTPAAAPKAAVAQAPITPAPKAAAAAPVSPAAAPAPAKISFKGDWSQSAAGELVAGGKLQLDYDLARFQALMHRGLERGAGWGVKAYVQPLPGGPVQEKELVRFGAGKDSAPQIEPHAFDISNGATAVQVWFKTWAADGKRPEAYDSNFGNNFTFPVRAK